MTSEIPPAIAAINERLAADQIEAHLARLAELSALISEQRARIRTLKADVARMEKLRPILLERKAIREALYRKEHGSRLALLE